MSPMLRKTTLALTACLAMSAINLAHAAGGKADLMVSEANVADLASVQRGAQLFVNYCLGCHSAEFMRYNRIAEDLELSEEMVKANLMFTDQKIGDPMTNSMTKAQGEAWFGKAPPDLSLIGRSRGPDWVYTYMKSFYREPGGNWNNTLLENAAMPHVTWSLEGIKEPVYESYMEGGLEMQRVASLELVEPGLMTAAEYSDAMRDLAAFIDYMGEPIQLERKKLGVWVMAFLAFFAFLSYLLKKEYWRDVD